MNSLAAITHEFGGENGATAALGANPEEDRWARYAFKLATGAGKTKVMSLAIVWSYFHALRETDSQLARHFVVIAPNLTVFERLTDDFGNGLIFDRDPLIPVAWRGDWNLSVVLQDEASGAATGGTLYLTNIHRLYDTSRRRSRSESETYDWMGPAVSKAKALDTGEALRARVTSHQRVLALNDEAHHLWDPDSAWNEALAYLHQTIAERTGGGLVAQLDFSATPKDDAHRRSGGNLRRTLVDQNGLVPIGLLRWCLKYSRESRRNVGGVFRAVRRRFARASGTDLDEIVDRIYSFRNEYIAHQAQELSDEQLTQRALTEWLSGLHRLWQFTQRQ